MPALMVLWENRKLIIEFVVVVLVCVFLAWSCVYQPRIIAEQKRAIEEKDRRLKEADAQAKLVNDITKERNQIYELEQKRISTARANHPKPNSVVIRGGLPMRPLYEAQASH